MTELAGERFSRVIETHSFVVLYDPAKNRSTNKISADGVLEACMNSAAIHNIGKSQLFETRKTLKLRRAYYGDREWT
jgi:hypothetical protein